MNRIAHFISAGLHCDTQIFVKQCRSRDYDVTLVGADDKDDEYKEEVVS